MARVSTYLNFARTTEQAFQFYRSVFKTEFLGPVMRYKDMPASPGRPAIVDADRNLIMHVELPILAGYVLMGTDALESMGSTVVHGNSMFINLEPDTRAETDHLFNALGDGGSADIPLSEMFWGGYFGSLVDQFGVRWMFNCRSKP